MKNQAARNQDDGVDGAVAADGAGDGAVAPMSLDGAAAADGAAAGAVARVSLEDERRRQEAVKHLLLDWTDKARLEQDKAQLQAEKARLERDQEKLRFDQAKCWGMLMEERGQELTATKPSAPLLLMLGETALFLQRNKSLGKAEQEQFLKKLLREIDATLLEVLNGWNRVAIKQKHLRSLVERIRKDRMEDD